MSPVHKYVHGKKEEDLSTSASYKLQTISPELSPVHQKMLVHFCTTYPHKDCEIKL